MKTDWVSMQVRCVLRHCILRFELSQAGAIGRKWYLERESESCERRKSEKFAQTVSHRGFNSPSGSFQRWLAIGEGSRGSFLGHLMFLWLLQERCSRRGTAREGS